MPVNNSASHGGSALVWAAWRAAQALLWVTLSLQIGRAQAPNARFSAPELPRNSELKLGSLEALRRLEAGADEEYTIGAGDEIEVEAVNRPELSGHHLVGPDGRITLPFTGQLQITNMTRPEAARAIEGALGNYYADVTVIVRVVKYGSNRILLVGHVAQPGVQFFDSPPTLLEALTRSIAGSRELIPAGTNSGTPPLPKRCAVIRGKDLIVWIDLKALLGSGGAAADMKLRRNDVVYVPDEQEDFVSVLGEVQHPGMVKLESNTKLVDVLAMSGGLTESGSYGKIRLVRPSTGVARDVDLQDFLNHPAKTTEISLQGGDVIYVAKRGLARIGYVLEKLSPMSTVLLFGASMGTR
jgi:polysaccharide export outer membrane protein